MRVDCPKCEGYGTQPTRNYYEPADCYACNGTGTIEQKDGIFPSDDELEDV